MPRAEWRRIVDIVVANFIMTKKGLHRVILIVNLQSITVLVVVVATDDDDDGGDVDGGDASPGGRLMGMTSSTNRD